MTKSSLISPRGALDRSEIRELHRRTFDQTWKWAGTYRKSDKNLGVPVAQIRERIPQLVGNVAYWLETENTKSMSVPCAFTTNLWWSNWGSRDLQLPGEAREAYLKALRVADNGDIRPLIAFSRF